MPEPAKLVNSTADLKLPPPSGDAQRAEKYIAKLIPLISDGKLIVDHTDLSKYDPSSLHDHYRIDMENYQLEISHSKQALTGKDSYVMLFNNLTEIEKGYTQKVILAYLILDADQFKKLQAVADEQIETRKKIEESKRFDLEVNPVDLLLEKITKGEVDLSKQAQDLPEIDKNSGTEEKSSIKVEPPVEEKSMKEDEPKEGGFSPKEEESFTSRDQNILAEVKPQEEDEAISYNKLPKEQEVSQSENNAATVLPIEQTPKPAAHPASVLEQASQVEIPPADTGPIAPEGYNIGTPPPAAPTEAANPIPISDVQKIIHQTAQNDQPVNNSPEESLPSIYTLPTNEAQVQPVATPPPSANIDQAIDQAFKPADNSILNQT